MAELSGKTVIVTGANSGIGFEATKEFAAHGASVVLGCRSTDRGLEAREQIEREVPTAQLTVLELDLADLSSVHAFVAAFEEVRDDLHILCNNAGVMAIAQSETADEFETQFGVNHLGHFALTGLLLDHLRETADETRVVTQSSFLHERGVIEFDDLQSVDDYDEWEAYYQSKLANLLFTYELHRRLRNANIKDVTSVACHPGYSATNLQRRRLEESGSWLRLKALWLANTFIAQDATMGTLPMLYAATAPNLEGAEYIGPDGFRRMRGYPTEQSSSDRSYDEGTAERLWEVSEERTGVRFDFDSVVSG